MSIKEAIDGIVHHKEHKIREGVEKLEQQYRQVCDDMQNCEADLKRCIIDSRGAAPDRG